MEIPSFYEGGGSCRHISVFKISIVWPCIVLTASPLTHTSKWITVTEPTVDPYYKGKNTSLFPYFLHDSRKQN